jgi:NAD-dependent deacetylase
MTDRAALRRLIETARQVAAFTGAGMSTESGVPDFRSPGGVWSRMKPIPFQDFIAREDSRREAWGRAFSGAAGWTGAAPNSGHVALARLMAAGKLSHIITQNVDGLHQAAGAPPDRVIELHGNASYAVCLACQLHHELDDLRGPFLEQGVIPTCRACGGLVKTATISFGQPLPAALMARAEAAARQADLFLVLGSSLKVFPAAGLPLLAKRQGAALAIVNREPTDQDRYADLVLHDEIGPTLAEVSAP